MQNSKFKMNSRFSFARLSISLTLGIGCLGFYGAARAGQPVQPAETDPGKVQDPDFAIQGEYVKDGIGLQVVALGGGKFFCTQLSGGLPGGGWDGRAATVRVESDEARKLAAAFKKIERVSPSLGAKPPEKALVLFDDANPNTDAWANGKLDGGLLAEGTKTAKKFKSFTLHLEFRLPFKPKAAPGSQDRGNSGVYIFNRYEVQVLDAFGLHYFPNTHPDGAWRGAFEKDLGFKPGSDRTQFCGALYHFKTPDLNMCYPPLAWQTYDITFTAPKFEGGQKTANAKITVLQNGVKIHDQVEVQKGTGAGGKLPEVAEEAILLQGHGNPVRYRNIWLVPLE